MDHKYFFIKRIEFILDYYDTAVKGFRDLRVQIEEGAPPFDEPQETDNPEPPYLDEWLQASDGEDVLGRTCITMLSDSLKKYLNAIREEAIGFEFEGTELKKSGFVLPHIQAFCEIFDVAPGTCPFEGALLEQIALARNSIEHDGHLVSLRVMHSVKSMEKYPTPLFTTDHDLALHEETKTSRWFRPHVSVSEKALRTAAGECIKLAEWVEENLPAARRWRHRQAEQC